jgi:hypothetical protein
MQNERDVEYTPDPQLSGMDQGRDISRSARTDIAGGTSSEAGGMGASRTGGTDAGSSAGSLAGTSGMGTGGGAGTTRPGTEGLAGSGAGHAADGEGRGVAADAKDLASSVKDRAVERVEERITDNKHRAVDQLEDVAQSLRSAGAQLPADNAASRYIVQAANQVDHLASFLNNRDVSDLLHDVEDFARRQPAVFVGGAFALGVLGARFLKSSQRNRPHDTFADSQAMRDPTARVEDPTRDAVSRPEAPGYAAPSQRGDTGFGDPGAP